MDRKVIPVLEEGSVCQEEAEAEEFTPSVNVSGYEGPSQAFDVQS